MEKNISCDVAVIGGGIAGVSAAVGARKAGAKVLLIERSPYLGGEATHCGVGAFCGFYTCGGNPVKVVSGVGDLVLNEMQALGIGYDEIISATGNKNINFRQEYLKCALDRLMAKENVEFLCHASVIGTVQDERQIRAIHCMDDDGYFTVSAKCFVDASGDANLTRMAGARTSWADGGQVQAATLTFRMSGVDTSKDMTPTAVEKAIVKAKQEGIPHLTKEKGFILRTSASDIVTVLLPSVFPENLSASELTRLEVETRDQVLNYVKALKKYMPGMENADLAVMGPSIGFRETRKIIGRETIVAQDLLTSRKRENGVARGGWTPEIHKNLNKMGTYVKLPENNYFDIPLGALQSADFDNLYAAGRMISADETALASVRVMGTCFATGHAAGVAAALQAKSGTADAQAIRAELTAQGALV